MMIQEITSFLGIMVIGYAIGRLTEYLLLKEKKDGSKDKGK